MPEPHCRICHNKARVTHPLFTPCKCFGIPLFVHKACIKSPFYSDLAGHCELCQALATQDDALDPQTAFVWKDYWAYTCQIANQLRSCDSRWYHIVPSAVLMLPLGTFTEISSNLIQLLLVPDLENFEGESQMDWLTDYSCMFGVMPFLVMLVVALFAYTIWQEHRQNQTEGNQTEKNQTEDPTCSRFAKMGANAWNLGDMRYVVFLAVNIVPVFFMALYFVPFLLFTTYYVIQLMVIVGFNFLALSLQALQAPEWWISAAQEAAGWKPRTILALWAEYGLAIFLVFYTVDKNIAQLAEGSIVKNEDFCEGWKVVKRVLPVLVFAILLPYTHGLLVVDLLTSTWKNSGIFDFVGYMFWLIGAISWWDQRSVALDHAKNKQTKNKQTKDFVFEPAIGNYVNLLLLFFEITLRNGLVVGMLRSIGDRLGVPPVTLSLNRSHVPLIALIVVALGTPIAQNQPPLAYVAVYWLKSWLRSWGLGSSEPPQELPTHEKPQQPSQSEDDESWPAFKAWALGWWEWLVFKLILFLRTVMLFVVLGVVPLVVGRFGYACLTQRAPNDILVWATALAFELPTLGLVLLIKSPSPDPQFEQWSSALGSPTLRLRSTLTSLTILAVFLVLQFMALPASLMAWIVPDVIFRVLTIAWPTQWYTYILFPFMIANTRGTQDIPQMVAMLVISGEWRIPVDWFHLVMRKTYSRLVITYEP